MTDQMLPNVVLDVQSDAVIRGDALIAIQRDSLGLYTEVISMDLRTGSTKLLHKGIELVNHRIGAEESSAEAGSLRKAGISALQQHRQRVQGGCYGPAW